MSKKKITIQDVARQAGTSASTVSRVLTGNVRVSEAKRQAVEEAIQRLGYRPSLLARSLKTQSTFSIGLLINDITNPFYSVVTRGVEEVATERGYSLILCNTNEDPQRELQYLQMLHDKQVDGIIFGPTGQNVAYIRQLAKSVPLVQIDRRIENAEIAAVLVDNEGSTYHAVRYLIERGHRCIGYLGWNVAVTTGVQRRAGYERALREAGLALDPTLVVTTADFSLETIHDLALDLLTRQPRPSALFASNNQLGLMALRVIREAGLRIPDDIALIVFDDLDIFTLTTPPISAIAQPTATIGRKAMQLLIERIENPEGHLPEVIILPTRLVVRESI